MSMRFVLYGGIFFLEKHSVYIVCLEARQFCTRFEDLWTEQIPKESKPASVSSPSPDTINIDDKLRQAGWDPDDPSQIQKGVRASKSGFLLYNCI